MEVQIGYADIQQIQFQLLHKGDMFCIHYPPQEGTTPKIFMKLKSNPEIDPNINAIGDDGSTHHFPQEDMVFPIEGKFIVEVK